MPRTRRHGRLRVPGQPQPPRQRPMQNSRLNGLASSRLAVALVVSACVLGGGMTSAWAKKRIVLLNFTGHDGKKAQAALVARMKHKYTLVPQAAFQKTAKQLHIRRPNDDDVANVARKLRADAVVAGQVKKSGKSYELTVTVRDGASGRPERVAIPLKGGRLDSRALAQLDREVLPLLDRAEGGSAVASATAATDNDNPLERRTTTRSSAADPPAQQVTDEPTAGAMGVSRGAAGDDRSETEVSRAGAAERGARPWWRPIATAAVDFGGVGRNLSMDGTTIQGYSGSLVASIGLGIGLYPMAGSSGMLRGLGLYASYDKVVSVSSTLSCGAQSQSLDSAQQALTFGAEYGYRLHETEDAMTVGGRVG